MNISVGPLSATLDGLALRWLCWRGVELLRGVAFVVRDEHWRTLQLEVQVVENRSSAERIDLRLRGLADSARLVVDMAVIASSVRVVVEGACHANVDFAANRVGLVVLHGEGCVGRPVSVEHASGGVTNGRFPDLISAHQPFLDMSGVTRMPRPGLSVRVKLSGEVFEMEDHRNWSDAGFKTYSQPLTAPRPFVIPAGTSVSQRVEVAVEASSDRPRIARGAPAHRAGELSETADLLVAETESGRDLADFRHLLEKTGLPGAVLLEGQGDRRAAIGRIAAAMGDIGALLIANATPADIAYARSALPKARIGGGSDLHFAELNRHPPPRDVDIVFWGVSATVHAHDDASMMETLHVLADEARTARALAGDAALWVGPIAIGARWASDDRDATAIGAAFLRGHLAAWAEAGVETIILPHTIHSPIPAARRQRIDRPV